MKIKGAADTNWSEDEGTGDDKKSVTYWGHIDYIKSKTQLFIAAKQDGSKCAYTFEYLL